MDSTQQKKNQPSARGQPRLPITRRAGKSELPGFRITLRDVQVVKAVYTHRALTTPQIETLLFRPENGRQHPTKTSRCRHRLKLLFQYGILFRDEQPTRLSEGRKPLVYFIDKGAIPLLADAYDVFHEEIDWSPRENKVTWRFLDHWLATNDVRIAIEVAVGEEGLVLQRWLDEKTLKSREMKESVEIRSSGGRTTMATIVPDGYFKLSDGEYEYHHLLEADRGTETVQSAKFGRRDFTRKIRGYLAYYASGRYEAKYGARSMRVLIVTTSRKRMANLRALTERVGGGEQFWFTTFDEISPNTVLTEPIWEKAGHVGAHPLIW